MSEMVERVANALVAYWLKGGLDPSEPNEGAARAAIAAMREPTEKMIESGVWSRSEDGRYGPRQMATTIYGAMIDEALK